MESSRHMFTIKTHFFFLLPSDPTCGGGSQAGTDEHFDVFPVCSFPPFIKEPLKPSIPGS